MGFGVLEPASGGHVPGTVLLDQNAAHSLDTTSHLKHATGKDSHLILAPQPSEDPNDPLNWSWAQKHVVLGIVMFGTIGFCAAPGPLLNAGIVQMSIELNQSVTALTKLSGYLLLATGATGPFVSALGRKYGKRPVYLASSIIGLVGCIIGEIATGYNTLIVCRVLQGVATSAYESLVIATIGDLFFVHERGLRVALAIFLLSAISNAISIIAGVITARLGWHYNFHILLPFLALQTILFIFFAPETMYRRKAIYDIDTAGSEEDLERLSKIEDKARRRHGAKSVEEFVEIENTLTHTTTAGTVPPRKTFVQQMAVFNGTFVDDSVFKMVLACPAILSNVTAAYTIFTSGTVIAWYVAMSLLSSVIFTAPPYLFTAAGVGYTSVGPFTGGVIATVLLAIVSDRLTKWVSRKNGGIYEPEFSLLLLVFGCITSVAGLVSFGYACQNLVSVYLICFIWGLTLFGMTIIATVTTQYALDSFRHYSTEIFIMNMVYKNFFFYGLTNYIVGWYTTQGSVRVFSVQAGVTAGICLLGLPVYVFGKKYRSCWHRYNVIQMLKLETDKTGAD